MDYIFIYHPFKGRTLVSHNFTKTEHAYNQLKADILEIKLQPSMPLRIKWLQEVYDLGTTPLREALNRLERDHLVISQPNKGYSVAPVSIEQLLELHRTRALIKRHLLKEAIQFGDSSWEADIVAAHYLLSRAVSPASCECTPDENEAWIIAHDALDKAMTAAHKSPWLNRFSVQLTEHIRRNGRGLLILMPLTEQREFLKIISKSPSLRTLYSIETYSEIKDAVLNRDADMISSLCKKYTNLVITANTEMYTCLSDK